MIAKTSPHHPIERYRFQSSDLHFKERKGGPRGRGCVSSTIPRVSCVADANRRREKKVARIIVHGYNYREHLHVKGGFATRTSLGASSPTLLVNLLSQWFLAAKRVRQRVYLKGRDWCGVISTVLQSTKGHIVCAGLCADSATSSPLHTNPSQFSVWRAFKGEPRSRRPFLLARSCRAIRDSRGVYARKKSRRFRIRFF